MNELFEELPKSKSPRLAWLEKYRVEISGPDIDDEILAVAKDKRGIEKTGYGHDEQSALADLARKCGWRLWNEEQC